MALQKAFELQYDALRLKNPEVFSYSLLVQMKPVPAGGECFLLDMDTSSLFRQG
jgi:hypothetical protein